MKTVDSRENGWEVGNLKRDSGSFGRGMGCVLRHAGSIQKNHEHLQDIVGRVSPYETLICIYVES